MEIKKDVKELSDEYELLKQHPKNENEEMRKKAIQQKNTSSPKRPILLKLLMIFTLLKSSNPNLKYLRVVTSEKQRP